MIHKMRNTAPEILSGEVITIPIVENSPTDLEETVLMAEMLIITHIENQSYGYQYFEPQRGSYRRRFGRGFMERQRICR